jgi:type I restriction enzyme M protein
MRARLQTALNKHTAEFFKIADVKYDKITTSIQEFFDTRLKEAVIAFGADREQAGDLRSHLREYLDGQREYSLSFDKYTGEEIQMKSSGFEMVTLGDSKYFRIESGGTPKSEQPEFWNGAVDWVTLVDLPSGNFITEIISTKRTITETGLNSSSAKLLPPDSILVSSRATIGRIGINKVELATNQGFKNIVINDKKSVDAKYVAYIITALVPEMEQLGSGATYKEISKQQFSTLQIPLPPIEIQKQIVAEIEAYQKVVDGCNLIIGNYKPDFDVNADWPVVKLHTLCETITDGDHMPPPKSDKGIPFVTISNIKAGYGIDFSNTYFVSEEYYNGLKEHRKPKKGDILYTVTGSFGIPVLIDFDRPFCFQRHIGLIRPSSSISNSYLYFYLQTPDALAQAIKTATGVAQKTVALSSLRTFSVPLPPLETQQKIVAELEEDLAAVAGAKRLKAKMEANIRATIGRVWGESP